jgi:hypothetical protein
MVAYEALCRSTLANCVTFVSIGSPLGVRNLIFDQLDPRPVEGIGMCPAAVREWINIADAHDIVALVKQLQPRFGLRVTDVLVSNGARAHSVERYLTSREMGAAVGCALSA